MTKVPEPTAYRFAAVLTVINILLPMAAIAAGYYLIDNHVTRPTCAPEGTQPGQLVILDLSIDLPVQWSQLGASACKEAENLSRRGANELAKQTGLNSRWDAAQFSGFRHTNGDLLLAYITATTPQPGYLELQQKAARARVAQTKSLGFQLESDAIRTINNVPCLEIVAVKQNTLARTLTCQADDSYQHWLQITLTSTTETGRRATVDALLATIKHSGSR